MTAELLTRVVRQYASEKTHVAEVLPASLAEYVSFGRPFTGLAAPVGTRCGVVLRSRVAVCMNPGTKVRCVQCRRLTGVEVAPEDNTTLPDPVEAR